MIISFGDAVTEEIYNFEKSARTRRFGDVLAAVKRKLDMIEAAHRLADLRVPPGNRLEALGESSRDFTVFVSTSSGGLSFGGRTVRLPRYGLRITTE